jgi:hypothetical protein
VSLVTDAGAMYFACARANDAENATVSPIAAQAIRRNSGCLTLQE